MGYNSPDRKIWPAARIAIDSLNLCNKDRIVGLLVDLSQCLDQICRIALISGEACADRMGVDCDLHARVSDSGVSMPRSLSSFIIPAVNFSREKRAAFCL